jgi:hypothetical protein
VCGKLKYSTQKAQHKHETLVDMLKIYVLDSSAIFLKVNHTVLLLGVRETDETVLSSAHGSSPSLNNIYSWIS